MVSETVDPDELCSGKSVTKVSIIAFKRSMPASSNRTIILKTAARRCGPVNAAVVELTARSNARADDVAMRRPEAASAARPSLLDVAFSDESRGATRR